MSDRPVPRPDHRGRPSDPAAVLTSELPIVLLPVRIETRFAPGQRQLRVRIYPDEITGMSHETALLPGERDAGFAYWTSAWDEAREREAWRALVASTPAPRAAWIVRATTPTNLAERPSGPPVFPEIALRQASWTGAVKASVLPDRWMLRLYRDGALRHQVETAAVPDPLTLSLDPSGDAAQDVTLPDEGEGLTVDPELAWTLEFDRALAVGMAAVVPGLSDDDLARGFDRVLVAGVRASLDPAAAAGRLASLFDGHHYDRGWAFVRQGTPTNNTAEAGSGYPPHDPNGSASFAVERGASLLRDGSDGERFAQALGLESEVVAHVAGAGGGEERAARAMCEGLFPATLGYFLEQMMHPVFGPSAIRSIRDFFLERVRARGPLAAFRIGSVPYGLLPVGALDRWQEGLPPSSGDAEALSLLRQLRSLWIAQSSRVPRIGRSGDPDRDLVETLAMDASAQEVWVRPAWGPDFQRNLLSFIGVDPGPWFDMHPLIASRVGAAIGHPEWFPRLAGLTFGQQSFRYGGPMVAELLSETAALEFDYVRWIRLASVEDLRQERFPDGVRRPAALLYRILRHAALTVYAQAALGLHVRGGTATVADRAERELVGVSDGRVGAPTVWDRFAATIPGVTGEATVAEHVLGSSGDLELLDVGTFRAALERVEGLPTAELDRLATETLDACSHRLDPWITGVYAWRLEELRARRPRGCHLGGFGWVEDLRPASVGGRASPSPGGSAGYVHAPSMAHAATAAILRNAYLTRSGAERSRYAIDLSSARVREALWLLDAVREGQPLGAVLGYRFERGLHEGHPGVELDKYIATFRGLYPIVADKLTSDGAPAEEVAARNVVDGLALRAASREGRIPFGQGGLPASGGDLDAIQTELRILDELVDAVTDLLTAESVYQLARGNATASAAALDALARPTRPPEPGVAAQPRGGTTYTQRLVILIGGDPPDAPLWAAIAATPRSRAEPWCDAWVAGLLGDPADVKCAVRFRTAAGPWIDTVARLDQLDLRPVDLLALAREPAAVAAGRSELDLRIAEVVEDSAGEPLSAIEVGYVPAVDPGSRTFPELLELCRSVNDLLGAARPLRPEDLVLPEHGTTIPEASRLTGEADLRAAAAADSLSAAGDDLRAAVEAAAAVAPDSSFDLAPLRRALRQASLFGVSGAFPSGRSASSLLDRAELRRRGESVLAELDDRQKRSASGPPEDRVGAVFGRDFPWLRRFSSPDPAALAAALDEASGLGADGPVLRRWFQQAAAVRAPMARWREVAILSRASAGARLPLEALQLPTGTGRPWVGLPFGPEENRPPGGSLSVVWHRVRPATADVPWVGLLVDEWTEVIPGREEQTAVSFHYDDPGAEAPQAVLLAVAPPAAAAWSLDLVFETLGDALDLAKLRCVDQTLLGELGQLLPALYLTANPKRDTVSTEIRSLLVGPDRIVARET